MRLLECFSDYIILKCIEEKSHNVCPYMVYIQFGGIIATNAQNKRRTVLNLISWLLCCFAKDDLTGFGHRNQSGLFYYRMPLLNILAYCKHLTGPVGLAGQGLNDILTEIHEQISSKFSCMFSMYYHGPIG